MVSIIVPVYNVENYLDNCIRSIINLKTDIELVLVDDGSTDHSGALCDNWAAKDSRIKVIHQENQGLSAARNTGIQHSAGDHIMFVDSDDFLDLAETEALLTKLLPETEIILGLYRNYYPDEDRYEKESCEPLYKLAGPVSVDDFLAAIPADGQSCYMIACRFIVRRDFLLANELFFSSGIYHEDEEWTQRLLCCADSIFVTHHFFYQYRQARTGAITSTVKPKHIFDKFIILQKAQMLLQKQTVLSVKAQYIQSRMAALYLDNMLNLYILKGQEQVEGLKQLHEWYDRCASHMCGKIGKIVYICTRVFGLRFTCFLLGVMRKIVK